MRLWLLGLCIAILATVAGVGIVYAFETWVPTDGNDHLLDGVTGLGGPKQ